MMFKKFLSDGGRRRLHGILVEGAEHIRYSLSYRHLRARWYAVLRSGALLGALLGSASGCRTLPSLPAANLNEPGWTVRQGQAVWRRGAGSPELAGELLVGTRTNGDAVVQFSKTPFPIVIAQKTTKQWQIQAPAQNETHVRPGRPPVRIIWFRLAEALAGDSLPRPWLWRYDQNDWSLENQTSGESLSGYLLQNAGRSP